MNSPCNAAGPRADTAAVKTTWIHLTARLTRGAPDLSRQDTGAWLWAHLRAAFPAAIAVMLMPDHPHLVTPSADPDADARRLARLLGQFGRCFGVEGRASRVAAPESIRPGHVLARQVRYVALNPCRRGLARCPLAWPWSTHRDLLGACLDPWVTATRLAAALGAARVGFEAHHHAYVSGDPHAEIAGTPMPVGAVSTSMPAVGPRAIAQAVAAATRMPLTALRRRGPMRAMFVALAFDQGWNHTGRLAAICGCTERAIQYLAADVDPVALRVTRLCLGDPRLRCLPDSLDPKPHGRELSGE